MKDKIINFISTHKIFSLATLYIITRVAVFFYPFDSDHYIFYLIGKQWFAGEKLYTELFDHKPPMIFFFNGILSLISDNIWIQRLVFIAISLLGLYLFKKLIDILYPIIFSNNPKLINPKYIDKTKFLLLACYIFIVNLAQVTISGNNTENFSLPIITAIYLVYFTAKYRGNIDRNKLFLTFKQSFLIGFLASMIFYLKPNLLIIFVPIFIDILMIYKKNLSQVFKAAWQVVLGFLPLNILIYYYFYSVGSFNDFIIASYTFSAKYAVAAFGGRLVAMKVFVIYMFNSFVLLLPYFVGVYLYMKKQSGNLKEKLSNNVNLFLIIPVFSFLITGTFFTYYVLSLAPFMAIGYVLLITNVNFKKLLPKILLIVFIVGTLAYSYKQGLNSIVGEYKQDFEYLKQAAEYVKENSEETDKIYANVYGSTFYYFANRDNFSRFSSTSHILLDSKYNFGYHFAEEWKAKAEEVKPKFIIVDPINPNLYGQIMDDYIKAKYQEVANFTNYAVWQRIETIK